MLFLRMTKRQSSSPTVRMIWERPWNQFSPFWMKKEKQLTSTSLPQFWIYNPQKECRRKEGQQPQKSLASEAQSGEQCRLWILKHWVNSQILGQRSWWVVSCLNSRYFLLFCYFLQRVPAYHNNPCSIPLRSILNSPVNILQSPLNRLYGLESSFFLGPQCCLQRVRYLSRRIRKFSNEISTYNPSCV